MHCTTQPESWKAWKDLGVGFSSCAAPNYLLSCARVFSVMEVRKLIWKWCVAFKKRLSIDFRWKLEVFQKYGIRVQNHGEGQVDNEDKNQSQYLNMSNTYIGRSLTY